MKGFPLIISIGACICSMAAELPGNNSEANVEARRAEAMGKPMEKFKASDGKTYLDVVITKIDDGGVSFKHADGVARLRHSDLSPEQRKYFGIDEETAADIYVKEAEQRTAYEKRVAVREGERRILAEKEALDLAEMRRLEAEIAASLLAIAKANGSGDKDEVIPDIPTIKRVDTPFRNTRRYSSYGRSYSNYGLGYSGYRTSFQNGLWHYGSGYRGGYRYGGHSHGYGASIIIRR